MNLFVLLFLALHYNVNCHKSWSSSSNVKISIWTAIVTSYITTFYSQHVFVKYLIEVFIYNNVLIPYCDTATVILLCASPHGATSRAHMCAHHPPTLLYNPHTFLTLLQPAPFPLFLTLLSLPSLSSSLINVGFLLQLSCLSTATEMF